MMYRASGFVIESGEARQRVLLVASFIRSFLITFLAIFRVFLEPLLLCDDVSYTFEYSY